MSQTGPTPARRVPSIELLVLLLAVVPAGAAFASEASPIVTPTPLPKVEVQTVGTGPRFLTTLEEQKLALVPAAATVPLRPASRLETTSRILPWSPKSAMKSGADFSTFLPIPGFDTRAFAEKPFVVAPNTAVEKKAGPAR